MQLESQSSEEHIDDIKMHKVQSSKVEPIGSRNFSIASSIRSKTDVGQRHTVTHNLVRCCEKCLNIGKTRF